LNETEWLRSSLIERFSLKGVPWTLQVLSLLEWNRYATLRRYSWEVTIRAQMARNGDFSALQKFEDNFDRQKNRLYMKNFVGEFCIEELRAKLLRVAESLDALHKRRLELATALAH
ncbi:MAG TPA: hypothetical protein VMI53_01775, partial [Opitutaceae bacterium]|nr:hypothetical protein [Opitutaceae bacterium]